MNEVEGQRRESLGKWGRKKVNERGIYPFSPASQGKGAIKERRGKKRKKLREDLKGVFRNRDH